MKNLVGNLVIMAMTATPEKPATPEMPQPVQDLIRFCNDASTWLIAISAVVSVALGIYRIIKWYTAKENDKPAAEKAIKTTVIGALGVILFEVLLKLFLSYFSH